MLFVLLLACATGRGLADDPAAAALSPHGNPRAAVLAEALADCEAGRCFATHARGSDSLRQAYDLEGLSDYLDERFAVLGAPTSVGVVREVIAGEPEVSVMQARVRFEHGELLGRARFEHQGDAWLLADLHLPIPLGAAHPPALEELRQAAESLVDDAWSGRGVAVSQVFGGDLAEPTLAAELGQDLVLALDADVRPAVPQQDWRYDRGAWRIALPTRAGAVDLAWARSQGRWRVVGVELSG